MAGKIAQRSLGDGRKARSVGASDWIKRHPQKIESLPDEFELCVSSQMDLLRC